MNYDNTKTGINYADAETRGKLRAWKRKLATDYAIFCRAYGDMQKTLPIVGDMVRGTTSTRNVAYHKLTKLLGPGIWSEGYQLQRGKSLAIWSILKPRNSVMLEAHRNTPESEIAALAQDCVCVNYIVAGLHRVIFGEGLWTLEVPDHALGRAVERSQYLHPAVLIREAHTNLLNMPSDKAAKLEYLKAGPGCFAGEWSIGKDASLSGSVSLHFRVRTWLSDDMLGPDQVPMCEEGDPGSKLGNLALLPRPLLDLGRVQEMRLQ